jgi:hypothetical protein
VPISYVPLDKIELAAENKRVPATAGTFVFKPLFHPAPQGAAQRSSRKPSSMNTLAASYLESRPWK